MYKPRFLLSMLVSAFLATASPSSLSNGRLDTKSLRQLYLNGDVEMLKKSLHTYLRNPASRPEREDSIFIFKYLGVMAAVDSNTLVLGQSYFTQLLKLSPNIQLIGMYEPARVKQVFQQVRQDLVGEQAYQKQFDEYGNPRLPNSPLASSTPANLPLKTETKKVSTSKAWLWWALGISALSGTGYAGYYVWNEGRQRHPSSDPVLDIRK